MKRPDALAGHIAESPGVAGPLTVLPFPPICHYSINYVGLESTCIITMTKQRKTINPGNAKSHPS